MRAEAAGGSPDFSFIYKYNYQIVVMISHNYTNTFVIRRDSVEKHYGRRRPVNMAVNGLHYVYTGPAEERMEREYDMLSELVDNGINVPRPRSFNPKECSMTMDYVNMINARDILEDPNASPEKKQKALSYAGRILREVHELGEHHGNPVIHNLGLEEVDNGMVPVIFDFEHRHNVQYANGELSWHMNLDLFDLLWSSVHAMRKDLSDGNIDPVLGAISDRESYGILPKQVMTSWVWMNFHTSPENARLYRALRDYKI